MIEEETQSANLMGETGDSFMKIGLSEVRSVKHSLRSLMENLQKSVQQKSKNE